MNPVFLNHQRIRRLLPWIIAAWTLIILFLTLAPSDSIPDSDIFDYDKLGHLLVFGGWTFWAGLYILVIPGRVGTSMFPVAVTGFLFGAAIELLQYITPFNRSASWADALANGIGCLAAYYLLAYIQRILLKKRQH